MVLDRTRLVVAVSERIGRSDVGCILRCTGDPLIFLEPVEVEHTPVVVQMLVEGMVWDRTSCIGRQWLYSAAVVQVAVSIVDVATQTAGSRLGQLDLAQHD